MIEKFIKIGQGTNIWLNISSKPNLKKFFCEVPKKCTLLIAIILVLSVFFNAIFRLTDFSSDAFDFSSSKTG